MATANWFVVLINPLGEIRSDISRDPSQQSTDWRSTEGVLVTVYKNWLRIYPEGSEVDKDGNDSANFIDLHEGVLNLRDVHITAIAHHRHREGIYFVACDNSQRLIMGCGVELYNDVCGCKTPFVLEDRKSIVEVLRKVDDRDGGFVDSDYETLRGIVLNVKLDLIDYLDPDSGKR